LEAEAPTPLAPGKLYRFAWSFYLGIALAAAVWIGLSRKIIPLSLFFDRERWWLDLAAGLGAGLLLVGFWLGLGKVSRLARDLEARLTQMLGPLRASEAIGLALLSGFAEELFFRGALQGAVGLFLATLLFGLLHSGPGPAFRVWTLFAVLAGAVFGLLLEWRGNLLAPIVGHAVVNAVSLVRLGRRAERADRFGRLDDADTQKPKEI
jgi:membrane protease YdiL (CAAX protease family)